MGYFVNNFDLMSLIKLAIKNAFLILLTGVVFAAAVFGYYKFMVEPKYSATGSVLVTNGAIMTDTSTGERFTLNNSDIVASMNIVDTIADILNTNGIYKRLSQELDGEYSYRQLASMVSVRRKNEKSLFINVTFTTTDPKQSIEFVNEFLMLAPEYINEYVPNSEVAISTSDSADLVYLETTTLMAVAALVGMALVFFILVLIQSSNTVILNEEDFSSRFDITVLANIPDFEKSKNDKYKSRYNYSYGYSGRGGGY